MSGGCDWLSPEGSGEGGGCRSKKWSLWWDECNITDAAVFWACRQITENNAQISRERESRGVWMRWAIWGGKRGWLSYTASSSTCNAVLPSLENRQIYPVTQNGVQFQVLFSSGSFFQMSSRASDVAICPLSSSCGQSFTSDKMCWLHPIPHWNLASQMHHASHVYVAYATTRNKITSAPNLIILNYWQHDIWSSIGRRNN